jgi:hypothetical protein
MLLDIERILGDKEYRDEMKHRCITDHMFLGRLLGKGFNKFVEAIHRPAADLYVKKKPGLPIEEQDTVKNRLHLDPRKTFKTTMGHLDTIQWVLVDPDMTILNEGATQPLAKAISNVQSSVFVQPKGRAPTAFQALFPEYCVPKQYDGWYQAPCRTYAQVDMTIDTTSVITSQAGFHPWVFNADDAVDTTNSGIAARAEVRESVISNHNTNIYTLRKGGYLNGRGTRYHPFDMWAAMLKQARNNPENWKTLVRSAMRVKSGKRLTAGEPFPDEMGVDLVFPGIIDYTDLRADFGTDYEAFMCQQMNDPQGGGLQVISEDLYRSCLIADGRVPMLGEVLIFWRPACGQKDWKYAEGCAVRILAGKVYVVDAWRGMYTPTGFAEKVIAECKRHQTGALGMEQIPGWEHIGTQIRNEAAKRNRAVRMDWTPFEEEDGARIERCKALEPMLVAGRVMVSQGCGQGPEMERQFIHLTMIPEYGLVDVVSRLALRIPASVINNEMEREDVEAYRRARNRDMSDFIFNSGGADVVVSTAAEMIASAPEFARQGLPNILGGLDG